ncbi:MAG: hypothetical protein IPJ57_16850 [Gemmatimonadetes bacterium]|nr:hypothetical protein [Gemmatimonadota bacterium]
MSQPPEDLRDLDRLLRGVRFEPRASLGPEIAGRWRQGERPGRGTPHVRRWIGIAAAVAMVGLGLFIFWLAALQPLRAYAIDHCCQDLDGGGDADDGLMVVARRGTEVRRLAIYEDRDGSRTFTPGDAIRFDRTGRPVVTAPLLPGIITTEFCCLDYDGGGPSDDALVVMGLPPDRISMAAIYERGAVGELR